MTSPNSVRIEVEYPDSDLQNDSFVIELPTVHDKPSAWQQHHTATFVFCQLKRLIASSTQLDPLSQQLSFSNSGNLSTIDDDLLINMSLFPKLYCSKRARNPINQLKILSFNKDEHVLNVDKNDAVIDIKFILAQMLGTQPEYLQFVKNFSQRILSNTDTLVTSGLLKANSGDDKIHYWLELPSESPRESSFVVRSIANLIDTTPEFENIGFCFRRAVQKFGTRDHLGTRTWHSVSQRGGYKWQTFEMIGQRVSNIASGMVKIGLQKGARVGICAANRAEWVICDYANHCQGFVTVPLYDTLSKNAIEYIVNHANVEAICCTKDTLQEVLKAKEKCPSLRTIILMNDEVPDQVFCTNTASGEGSYTYSLSDIESLGASNPVADNFGGGDDLCMICYTSGTTGNPKGVMLTHRNILVSVQSYVPKLSLEIDENGVLISYLPLAHMYEKLMELVGLIFGCRIGYWSGDVLTLLDDIETLKPTYFAGVPRVYQRFQDKILAQVNSSNFIKKALFNRAYQSKQRSIENKEAPSALWDKLVFSKLREKFGGRVKSAVSGSAPLSATNANFIKICFSDVLVQGYGLTETCAAGAVSDRDDPSYGHNGPIGSSVEMKLVDVADMNYFANDHPHPRGEIWLRGPSIFRGYYKMEDKTNEVLSKDGWFATGDVGEWCLNGCLKIIDRKKNIFKLAQGEYIRPDYIENVYKQCIYVANIFVHGDSDQTFLVAVVVPDFEVLIPWGKQKGLCNFTFENATNEQKLQLIKNPKVHQLVLSEMDKIAVREELTGFEKIKRITLVSEDFTVENGILTSTMKLKRNFARNVFKNEIASMYQSVAQSKL